MRPKVALVLLRLWLGVWFVLAGYPKLSKEYFATSEGNPGLKTSPAYRKSLECMLTNFAEKGAMDLYRPFLKNVVLRNVKIFAALTAFGEVAAGVALIGGLLTHFASLAIVVMCGNYFLATYNFGGASQTANVACVAIALALVVGAAGQYAGLDALGGGGKKGAAAPPKKGSG